MSSSPRTPTAAGVRPLASLLALLLLVPFIAAEEAKKPLNLTEKEQEEIADGLNGVFDFTKEPRSYPSMLILDQEGNRYPSFWAGGNAGGKTTITARYDVLEDAISLQQEGGFKVQLITPGRKFGMEDQIPGGPWIRDWKSCTDIGLVVSIDSIEDTRITDIREGSLFQDIELQVGENPKLITLSGSFTGSVSVHGKSAPIEGDIDLTFLSSITMFAANAVFPLPGEKLGLKGKQGAGITARLYTASAASFERPEVGDSIDELNPFGDLD